MRIFKKFSKILTTFFFRSTKLIFRALPKHCFGSAGGRIHERKRVVRHPPPPPPPKCAPPPPFIRPCKGWIFVTVENPRALFNSAEVQQFQKRKYVRQCQKLMNLEKKNFKKICGIHYKQKFEILLAKKN